MLNTNKITVSRVEIREVIKVIIIFGPFLPGVKYQMLIRILRSPRPASSQDRQSETRVKASHGGFSIQLQQQMIFQMWSILAKQSSLNLPGDNRKNMERGGGEKITRAV